MDKRMSSGAQELNIPRTLSRLFPELKESYPKRDFFMVYFLLLMPLSRIFAPQSFALLSRSLKRLCLISLAGVSWPGETAGFDETKLNLFLRKEGRLSL
jgi:hypothetical protein